MQTLRKILEWYIKGEIETKIQFLKSIPVYILFYAVFSVTAIISYYLFKDSIDQNGGWMISFPFITALLIFWPPFIYTTFFRKGNAAGGTFSAFTKFLIIFTTIMLIASLFYIYFSQRYGHYPCMTKDGRLYCQDLDKF